jgi:hypothetical protein
MATVKISQNITYKEGVRSDTAIRNGIKNEPNDAQIKAMKELGKKVFEPLRANFEQPIRINSFFRSVALNKRIGGSATSQHCKGEAVDIEATNGVTNKQLFDFIKDNLEFDQLIWEFGTTKEPAWVHVSYTAEKPNRKMILKAIKDGSPIYQVITAGNKTEEIAAEKVIEKKKRKGTKGIVAVKTTLNVRKEPTESAKIVAKLVNNEKVKIVNDHNGWFQIKTGKASGWVSGRYIKMYKKK